MGINMLSNHAEIIQAIHDRHEVLVTFPSQEDEGQTLARRCAPMDYGPAKIAKPPDTRYHFWDFESDSAATHVLSLRADQVLKVDKLGSIFDPVTFVAWETDWHIPRDWGAFS